MPENHSGRYDGPALADVFQKITRDHLDLQRSLNDQLGPKDVPVVELVDKISGERIKANDLTSDQGTEWTQADFNALDDHPSHFIIERIEQLTGISQNDLRQLARRF